MCSHEEWERFTRRVQGAVDEGELREFVADAVARIEALVEELKSRACAPEDLAAALKAAIPGARVRIETPAGSAVAVPHMRHASDLSRAKEELGYEPHYGMPEAVRDLVAWFKAKAS